MQKFKFSTQECPVNVAMCIMEQGATLEVHLQVWHFGDYLERSVPTLVKGHLYSQCMPFAEYPEGTTAPEMLKDYLNALYSEWVEWGCNLGDLHEGSNTLELYEDGEHTFTVVAVMYAPDIPEKPTGLEMPEPHQDPVEKVMAVVQELNEDRTHGDVPELILTITKH